MTRVYYVPLRTHKSKHKVTPGEDNSLAASAGIRTRDLSITSPALSPTSYPSSPALRAFCFHPDVRFVLDCNVPQANALGKDMQRMLYHLLLLLLNLKLGNSHNQWTLTLTLTSLKVVASRRLSLGQDEHVRVLEVGDGFPALEELDVEEAGRELHVA